MLLTVIDIVVLTAHCPGFGVNVYVVVARLFKAGDQLPVIPFIEVLGNGDNDEPEQIGATALNSGTVAGGVIVIVNDAVLAHWPEFGVKV